ncbi:MAG: hypothetical protein ACPGID_05045 [Rubricella sp.]
MIRAFLILVTVSLGSVAVAQEAAPGGEVPVEPAPDSLQTEPPMTLDRMAAIVFALDPEARTNGVAFELTVSDVPVTIITDPVADRMRAMIPIRSADGMSREEIERAMQANFDTALDARYAIAQGRLWAVYIHPLSPLERDQFISGIGQLVNVALTYGAEYSGGLLTFGGGDSARIQRERIEELLRRGQDI